jgi:hypothetical protein
MKGKRRMKERAANERLELEMRLKRWRIKERPEADR